MKPHELNIDKIMDMTPHEIDALYEKYHPKGAKQEIVELVRTIPQYDNLSDDDIVKFGMRMFVVTQQIEAEKTSQT